MTDPLTIQTSIPAQHPPAAAQQNPSKPVSEQSPRSESPTRPPVSPITPRSTFAELARYTANRSAAATSATAASSNPHSYAAYYSTPAPPPPSQLEASFIPRPPSPTPIAEAENTDALALTAALAILQVQRERSRRDLLTWERIRARAAQDPAGFYTELEAGRLRQRERKDTGYLGPTLEGLGDAGAEDEDGEDEAKQERESEEGRVEGAEGEANKAAWPKLPEMQNIFRCPPVNWAKYHVVGESLDKLHEEQRKRPTEGEPQADTGLEQVLGGDVVRGQVDHLGRAPESVIARPYNIFEDGFPKGPRQGG
ncbi:MAG: hypothetical protein M1822_000044 [Bathelium mastoideum]|nr:MAG: hypothetical protein M1822_000044 [Bathelium mastoideum]